MPSAIALVSTPSRLASLRDWVSQHHAGLGGFGLLATGELARSLEQHPATGGLAVSALADLDEGGEIELAARVLQGELIGVICFVETRHADLWGSTLAPVLRACLLRQVPFALNEATATSTLRGLARSRRATLLFNPVAGQGDPHQDLALIRSMLEPQVLLRVVMTREGVNPRDQVADLVRSLGEPSDGEEEADRMILASGGDGTVSAVAGALIDSGVPLGILPRGTANAFASALGIPTDLRAACTNILVGNVRVVDAALCNDEPMILLAGVGFEASMVEGATRELKNRFGPLAYLLSGARRMVDMEPFLASVDVDGETRELDASAITVANVAPPTSVLAQGFGEVIPDDGQLEVTIAAPSTRLEGMQALATLVGSALSSTPADGEGLLTFRASRIRIETDPPQRIVVDGELLEPAPVEFRALPGSLRVIAPLTVA
jgi:YegS/Rv2252/BmrU family lipid kinase